MRAPRIALAGVALALTASFQAQAMVPRDAVINERRTEYNPAASETHVAWQQWEGTSISYVKPLAGGPKVMVNKEGWSGALGGINGDTLIYQQYSQSKGVSDIFTFDLTSQARQIVGPPVSTQAWEYYPDISDDHILFARSFPRGERHLVLYDIAKDRTKVIAKTESKLQGLYPGQVNGDFAVWGQATFTTEGTVSACNVFRYRISTGRTTRIDNPRQRCQFAPSMDESGNMYYGRSGWGCGLNVVLMKLPVGGSPQKVMALPDGVDFGATYAVDLAGGGVNVYYDRVTCSTNRADIYVETLP